LTFHFHVYIKICICSQQITHQKLQINKEAHPFIVIPAKALGHQVEVFFSTGIRGRKYPMACHSEGATRSKLKSKQLKVKGDVPKAKATEESPVKFGWKNQFELMQQKNRPCLWKRKILRRPVIFLERKNKSG
jgi:hypothetical protein